MNRDLGEFKGLVVFLSFSSGFVMAAVVCWFIFHQPAKEPPLHAGEVQMPTVLRGMLSSDGGLVPLPPRPVVKQTHLIAENPPDEKPVGLSDNGTNEASENVPLLGVIYEMEPPGVVEDPPMPGIYEGTEGAQHATIGMVQSTSNDAEKVLPSIEISVLSKLFSLERSAKVPLSGTIDNLKSGNNR